MSLFKVSDYLARNHSVTVVSDIEECGRTRAGVVWTNEYPDDSFDVVVSNRGTNGLSISAKHRVLWTHDLPHAGFIEPPKIIKAFSVVFMSRYAERIWQYYYKDIGKSFCIPNGVDKDIFYPREKDLSYLIYASAPNRGLKHLPFIFDCISEAVPGVYMRAYSNLKALHPGEMGEEDEYGQTYNDVKASKVTLCEPVPQKELSEELGRASLMVLPSDYPEICSNIILQSLASGTPVITTGNLGSSGEWIKHRWNGMLTEWQPHDYMAYQLNVIRESVKVLKDEKLHRKLIQNASKTKIYTWDQVGAMWEKMLLAM